MKSDQNFEVWTLNVYILNVFVLKSQKNPKILLKYINSYMKNSMNFLEFLKIYVLKIQKFGNKKSICKILSN